MGGSRRLAGGHQLPSSRTRGSRSVASFHDVAVVRRGTGWEPPWEPRRCDPKPVCEPRH